MASTISQAVLRRVAEEGRAPADLPGAGAYARPVPGRGRLRAGRRPTPSPAERPPMADVLQASVDLSAAGSPASSTSTSTGPSSAPADRSCATPAEGSPCDGVRALQLLHAAAVPVVLVSGRSRARLEAVATALGADGVLPEMGALDAGYPTADGQTVHEAIALTGVPRRAAGREPGLDPHPLAPPGPRGQPRPARAGRRRPPRSW